MAAIKNDGRLEFVDFFGLYAYANIPFLNLSEKTYKGSFLDQFDSYQLVGQSLSDVWQENDILIPEATGRIAYYIPKAFVRDPSGLTDKVLAHDPTALRTVFGRGNWHYSLSLKPTMIVLHYWPHQMLWPTLGLGYPEQFAFYCLPARLNALEEQWLLIVIHRDKVDHYAPPLVKLGALKIAYEDFANMETDYLECGK